MISDSSHPSTLTCTAITEILDQVCWFQNSRRLILCSSLPLIYCCNNDVQTHCWKFHGTISLKFRIFVQSHTTARGISRFTYSTMQDGNWFREDDDGDGGYTRWLQNRWDGEISCVKGKPARVHLCTMYKLASFCVMERYPRDCVSTFHHHSS